MQMKTRHFGIIDVKIEDIISFENGIPGFENSRKYIVIESSDPDSAFCWLQSVDMPDLAFAVVNPFIIKKDYDIEIDDNIVKQLGIKSEKEVLVYSIVVVPEDASKITMNLKAPIIINTASGKGAQIALDTDRYSVRHYILEELRRQEVAGDACSNEEEGSDNCNK